MTEGVSLVRQSGSKDFAFSVLIPTWNNAAMLQWCISALRKNSTLSLQFIVIVNEGSDGSLAWVRQQNDIDYVHAPDNIGICYGLNLARSLVRSDYILYLNDDMYVLPGWDEVLYADIQSFAGQDFMLSATMIEPRDTGNTCVVIKDYGKDLSSFREDKLLQEYKTLYRADWSGSTWPPNLVSVNLWDAVGGLSSEYSPGMYSDPDFSKKLYEAGVRLFKGNGAALVYHFGSKSTGRVRKNTGRKTFIYKWGISAGTFMRKYLFIGQAYRGHLPEVRLSFSNRLIAWLKRRF